MRGIIIIALILILSSCSPTISVLVIETMDNGKYHVVSMSDHTYSDVVKLPNGTSDGDIVKIKIKK